MPWLNHHYTTHYFEIGSDAMRTPADVIRLYELRIDAFNLRYVNKNNRLPHL